MGNSKHKKHLTVRVKGTDQTFHIPFVETSTLADGTTCAHGGHEPVIIIVDNHEFVIDPGGCNDE